MKTRLLFFLAALALISPERTLVGQAIEAVSGGARPSLTGGGGSFTPVISGGGNTVVFVSQANNLVTNDDRLPFLDLFVRDLSLGTTKLVNISTRGTGGGAGDSGFVSMSSNGQFIAFASTADKLVAGDTNSRSDVFVRDLAAGGTRLVSINAAGTGSTVDGAINPVMSRNGRWVAFESTSGQLGPPKPFIIPIPFELYVRDLWSNVTVMASVNTNGTGGGSTSSRSPTITPDGRFVAFVSRANNLVPGAGNSQEEIYIRDFETQSTIWASAGVPPNLRIDPADDPLISDDGRFVVFTKGTGLFRYELPTSNTVMIANWFTISFKADFRASLSADGRWVAYQDGTNVWLADATAGTNILVNVTTNGAAPGDGSSFAPTLSADGQRVLFFSSASGLTTHQANGRQQIFLRDLVAGTTRLISANLSGAAANGDHFPGTVAWSDDGQIIAFESPADDLVADDLNQASDVFVRRLDTDTTECISRRIPELPSLTGAADSALVPDGVSSNASVVLFRSQDNNLVAGDTNGWADLFVRNAASNTVMLVTPLSDDIAGTNHPLTPYAALSANGRFAAWTSAGSPPYQIFRKDLETGTVMVAVTNATAFSDTFQRTNLFAISPDGTRIAYERTNQLFIRDLVADTDTRLSSAVAGWVYFHPHFSPDGRWLAYARENPSVNAAAMLAAYELSSGSNRLVTTYPGAIATVGNFGFNQSASHLVFEAYPYLSYGTATIYTHPLAGNPTNQFICYPCERPSMSADGRYVAYVRWPSNFSLSYCEIVLKDRQTGIEELVTPARWSRTQIPVVAISPDARFVVFSGLSGGVVPNDTNGVSDVFVRDRLLKITTCLSVNRLGVPATGSSGNPVLSVDGRTVVFQSTGSDLAVADYNDKRDVFAVRIGHDDTDGDGLDDDWEMAFFNTLARDGSGDFDGDGVSDRGEFFAGTDPTNQGSVLRTTTLVMQGGGNTAILWEAVPGRTYQVQFKNSLRDPSWSVLPGTVTAASTTGVMTDTTASGAPQRFYRLMLAP